MKKTIILTEKQQELLNGVDIEQEKINDILAESFCPRADQVLIVKNYLDKNFTRGFIDDIDDMASPTIVPVLNRMMMGKPIEQLSGEDIVLLLVDKFPNMVKDKKDLKKFMKQIVKDWYDKKISRNGVLSVNYLNENS